MNTDFILDWAGLGISFFNTISLFWLGLMVLLIGQRRVSGTWLTGSGLLLGALFFTSHTAILGRGIASTSFGMDFWWWVSWIPAVTAPIAWYGIMLWYAGFRLHAPHPHKSWLWITAGLGAVLVLLLVFANPLPSYTYVAARPLEATPSAAGIPLLIWTYVIYSLLCYLLPLDLLSHRSLDSPGSLNAAARSGARPWLIAASLFMLLAGVLMGWLAFWALRTVPAPTLTDAAVVRRVKVFDLVVAGCIALAITALGRAIVGYAVFTGRPLPRQGFFHQWRSTVILAAGYGTVVAWTTAIHLRPIYSLMLATALMTLFYALYSWRSSSQRETFMARLRPFVTSQDLYGCITKEDPPDLETPQALFESLCRDVLGTRAAALIPLGTLATLTGPPLMYGDPIPMPSATELTEPFTSPEVSYLPASKNAAWSVPLWNEQALSGVLMLGQKDNGNPYQEEEIEIAQAGGERVLDMVASTEMARLTMALLRQRLAQICVLENQGRRALHDEILPQLHTAILYLNKHQDLPAVQEAVAALTSAHHQVADLMRNALPATPHRLAQNGLIAALQALIASEFSAEFDAITWKVAPESIEAAGQLPMLTSEVVFFAARELLRNAARHGRGGENERQMLNLTLTLEIITDMLSLTVEDNGVGLTSGSQSGGAQSGLRFHNAMLAAVGARFEVQSLPGGGTCGRISIPVKSQL